MIVNKFPLLLIIIIMLIIIFLIHLIILTLQPFPARLEPRQPCDRSSHCWPRLKVTTKVKANHDQNKHQQ